MTKKTVRGLIDYIGRILYPQVCPLCGVVIDIRNNGTCDECRGRISYVQSPVCLKCGKEIFDEEIELCEDCSKYMRTYDKGFPAMNYIEPVTDCVAKFKYNNRRELADFFASEIIRCHGKRIAELSPEVLIPVPVHKKKLKKRGYNQAELLARSLGRRLDIPVDADIIKRNLNTMPQKKLDNVEREKNLKKAFISDCEIVQYKKVMLVDDIYTTGATIESCTSLLKQKGVEKVYYTSICIGKGY